MDNYQTPVRKKKPRILGMTLPQSGLLAGLIVVQLVILVLALKYIVFAREDNIPPPATPIPIAAILQPTLAPTPLPDLTTAVLTIDDLPAGFIPALEDAHNIDFNEAYPEIGFHPVGKFTFYDKEKEQMVFGWTFAFTTPEEREKFDIFVMHPNAMFQLTDNSGATPESLKGSELGKPSPIGELSSGWSVPVDDPIMNYSDLVLFSHKNFGGIVEVFYKSDQVPIIGAWEVAQKLDNRIMDVLVNGPIPTPVVIAYQDLAGVKLNQEDLPAGFQAVPEAELALDEASRSEMERGGMRVAGVFGFRYDRKNFEETVLGFTFQFTSTLGKVVMDQMLAGDELLDAMLAHTPTHKKQPFTINKPIGDRALGTAIMEMGEAGGVRCDVLVFRREYAGVALFHIYHTGIRQTNVENLALKLDAKIQALASP
jgi:hypothetical protein